MEEHIDLDKTQYYYKVSIDRLVEIEQQYPTQYQLFLNLDDQFIRISHLKEKQWFLINSTNEFNAQFTLLDQHKNKQQLRMQFCFISSKTIQNLEFKDLTIWITIQRVEQQEQNNDSMISFIRNVKDDIDYQAKYYKLQKENDEIKAKLVHVKRKYQQIKGMVQDLDQTQQYVLVPFKKVHLKGLLKENRDLLNN